MAEPMSNFSDPELIRDVIYVTVATIIGEMVCYAFARGIPRIYDFKGGKLLKDPTLDKVLDAADGIFCVPYFFVLLACALKGTWDVWAIGTVEARWFQSSSAARWFQILYVTRMVTHMPIQWVTLSGNKPLRLQMTAHHLLSVLCFGSGLITGRCNFFATLDGCCEASTVFLNSLFLLKILTPPEVGLG